MTHENKDKKSKDQARATYTAKLPSVLIRHFDSD